MELRHVALFFAEAPHTDADEEKTGGVDQAGAGGLQPVGADAQAKRLAGGADQREGGHRRPKHAHQKHERPDRLARHEEILAGPAEHPAGHPAKRKQREHVHDDDVQWRTGRGLGRLAKRDQ